MKIIKQNRANKKMTVLFFVGIFPVVSESWLVEQVVSLVKMGVDVRIFSFRKGGKRHVSGKIKKYNIMGNVVYLDFPKNKIIRFVRAIFLFLRVLLLRPRAIINIFNFKKYGAEAYSLKYLFWSAPLLGRINDDCMVHCHFGTVGNKFLILKELLGLKNKFVVSFYGYDISRVIKTHGAKVYRDLMSGASYFLPNSNLMKDKMIKIGFDNKKTIVINNGLNLDNYQYRKRVFTSSEKLKMVFVGRFVEKKGIEDMLRAISIVHKKYKNIRLTVVGGGDKKYEEKIKLLVNELDIEKVVVFLGTQQHDKVLNLYDEMHLAILLSKTAKDGDSEGLPYTLVEAQAAGLPVIATDHAGIPEVIINKKTGMIVREGSYKEAAQCIKRLIDDSSLLSSYSMQSRKFIVKRFGFENVNKKLLSIYKNVKNIKK